MYQKILPILLLFLTFGFSVNAQTEEPEPNDGFSFLSNPDDLQVIQRGENNQCLVKFAVEADMESLALPFSVKVYSRTGYATNYQYIHTVPVQMEPDGFGLNYYITAELKEWKFELVDGNGEVYHSAEGVVCGDIYAVLGQSNAAASIANTPEDLAYDSQHRDRYARAVGHNVWGVETRVTSTANLLGWGYARAIHWDHAFAGAYGLRFQKEIIDQHAIPVGIIVGAFSGSSIEQNLKEAEPIYDESLDQHGELNNPNFLGYNIFEYFLSKLERAQARGSLKYIIWNQGESNTPDHNPETKCGSRYLEFFKQMREDWYSELPALEKIYCFQLGVLSPWASFDSWSFVREAQRKADLLYSDVELLTSMGMDINDFMPDELHYSLSGYEKLALRTYVLCTREIYNPTTYSYDQAYVLHPNSVDYNPSLNKIEIHFDYDMKVGPAGSGAIAGASLAQCFYNQNDQALSIQSVAVSGNVVELYLTDGAAVPQSLSYLPAHHYNGTSTLFVGPFVLPLAGDHPVPAFYKVPVRPSYHQNNWKKVWSNQGHGDFNRMMVGPNTVFHHGDLNGDGADELLVMGGSWITVLTFTMEGEWKWLYTNYGGAAHPLSPYLQEDVLIEDFDGDGIEEVLVSDGSVAKLFKLDVTGSNGFEQVWTSASNTNFNQHLHNMVVGDFDNDGKSEVLGANWTSSQLMLFSYVSGNFVVDWTNKSNHPTYVPNQQWMNAHIGKMVAGDFAGNGYPWVVGFSANGAELFKFDAGVWIQLWDNTGNLNSFGGWSYPLTQLDEVLCAGFDNDTKDELFFIQNGTGASWSTSMDLATSGGYAWNWNWSTNPYDGASHIGDWPLSDGSGSDTRYFSFRLRPNQPESLIALRNFNCNGNRYLINVYQHDQGNKKQGAGGDILSQEFTMSEPVPVVNRLSVHPNPTSGKLNLLLQDFKYKDKVTFEVYNTSGQLVDKGGLLVTTSTREVTLDISPSLMDGMYLLKIIGDGDMETATILLNR